MELSVSVKWEEATTSVEEILLKTYEQSNPTQHFVLPKWRLVDPMEVGIDHK